MKKYRFIGVILSTLLFSGCGQFASDHTHSDPLSDRLDRLAGEGEYREAGRLIRAELAADTLSESARYDLLSRLDRMERIRKDFTLNDSAAVSYIRQYYPDVTDSELDAWRRSGALECKIIDGERRYFKSAPRNLFRISPEARKHREQVKGRQSEDLDRFLAEYIPQVVRTASAQPADLQEKRWIQERSGGKILPGAPVRMVNPVSFRIRYTLSVKADAVPDGETVRAWLPYPRADIKNAGIVLYGTSLPDYTISPESYPHRSLYMQQPARKGEPTVFWYELGYTSRNEWFGFRPEEILPYDKESGLYKRYTSQQAPHILFTPDIRRITDSVVGEEQNPYLKIKKIFSYIADTYPWASAREYSTLDNIPQYVIENKHGDCGQVSLLLITMARYAGIPAKWQSGWMMHPGEINLHDWAEIYYEGIGWVPTDVSFGYVQSGDPQVRYFFTRGLDAFRYIVNDDISGEFYPAKTWPRSETVDFQRGEAEWKGGNLYFDRWSYDMEILER